MSAFVGKADSSVLSSNKRYPVFQPDIQPQSSNLNNEGACIVKFDIDTIGKTQNIRSNCSSEDFQLEATRVIQTQFTHQEC